MQVEIIINVTPYIFCTRVNSLNLRLKAFRPSGDFFFIEHWDTGKTNPELDSTIIFIPSEEDVGVPPTLGNDGSLSYRQPTSGYLSFLERSSRASEISMLLGLAFDRQDRHTKTASNGRLYYGWIAAQYLGDGRTQLVVYVNDTRPQTVGNWWEFLRQTIAQQGWIISNVPPLPNNLGDSEPVSPEPEPAYSPLRQRKAISRSRNSDTRAKIMQLGELREQAIREGRPIPFLTGKYSLCKEASVSYKTVRDCAPRLVERWKDEDYVWDENDYIDKDNP